MCELTLEILDKALEQFGQFDYENEVIGFKLNPSDHRAIEDRLASISVVTNNKWIVQPPYKGLILEPDVNVPPGYPQPIRRSERRA